jgi:hypothetical protein
MSPRIAAGVGLILTSAAVAWVGAVPGRSGAG